ncbi:hypothetical protein [Spiroplasma clarkii]|uniref:hypothetical protein n=1 Tax=Spiroplasma clarkii TaxID=2139 RepID=UPI002029E574|nr:hypothetical protein [Spiroplasma clarkii]
MQEFIKLCKTNDLKCSLAISPDTKVSELTPYLADLDNVLVMTVYPGYGGQTYLPEAGKKIAELQKLKATNNYHYLVEVDGGINDATYKIVQEHGVDMIVAGSYLVGQDLMTLKERVAKLEN